MLQQKKHVAIWTLIGAYKGKGARRVASGRRGKGHCYTFKTRYCHKGVSLPLVSKSLLPKDFKSGPSSHCKWPRHTNATLHKAGRNSRRETWSRPHSSMHKTLWLTHYSLYGLHCILYTHLMSVIPTTTLHAYYFKQLNKNALYISFWWS